MKWAKLGALVFGVVLVGALAFRFFPQPWHAAIAEIDERFGTQIAGFGASGRVAIKTQPKNQGGISDGRQNLTVAIGQVANAAIPAVVHVEVTEKRDIPNPYYAYGDSPLLRQFFGLPKDMPKKFEEKLTGLGTGMLVDSKGFILTNNHVVNGATRIKVVLSNEESYAAEVVGTDPQTDLAVIKISADKPLPFVAFGDSDQVTVGQWVVAIGHPRGLDQTVTQGIISAKHRTGITNPSDYQDFLQTDAPINPGNSGGPLLSLDGYVIGVNSMIATQSGGSEGLGFSIPSNMAVHVANSLIQKGKVERGWLGAGFQNLTSDLAKSFDLPAPEGALIADVMKDGPADKAGMQRGDVVLAYGGESVRGAADLRNKVAGSRIGSKVEVTIWRNDKEEKLSVHVRSLDELRQKMLTVMKNRLGVVVGPVNEKESRKYGMSAPEGVIVQWVDPSGPLGKAGFEVGDIILALGKDTIGSVDMFLKMVGVLPPKEIIVLAAIDHRTGRTGYVKVKAS